MTARKQPYAYIRRYYKVTPVPGERVQHTVTQRAGTIIRPRGDPNYVRVRFDGDKHTSNAHPKELDYTFKENANHAG